MTEHDGPTLVSPDEEAAEEYDGPDRDVKPAAAEPKDWGYNATTAQWSCTCPPGTCKYGPPCPSASKGTTS